VDRLGDLASYALDELDVWQRSALEEHVATCPGCLAELSALALAAELLTLLWARPAGAIRAPAPGPKACPGGRWPHRTLSGRRWRDR